ncbi:hypothetical protein J6500_15335 [Bradyrhizobium sp. WSM 1704]|nr:hypothetical protein [Bradyrhizobium semiaridum]
MVVEDRPKRNGHSREVIPRGSIERSGRDWIVARRNHEIFEAFGGPMNLGEMIEIFLVWADWTPQTA